MTLKKSEVSQEKKQEEQLKYTLLNFSILFH